MEARCGSHGAALARTCDRKSDCGNVLQRLPKRSKKDDCGRRVVRSLVSRSIAGPPETVAGLLNGITAEKICTFAATFFRWKQSVNVIT